MNDTIKNIKQYYTDDRLNRLDSIKPIQIGPLSPFGKSVTTLNDPVLFVRNMIQQIEFSHDNMLEDDEQNLSYRAALNHLQTIRKI